MRLHSPCFSECTGIDTADTEWLQVQLSLGRGGVLAFAVLLSILQLSKAGSVLPSILQLSKAGSLIPSDEYALELFNIFNSI